MEIDDIDLPESDVKFEEEDMVIDLMVMSLKRTADCFLARSCGS